MSLAVDCMSLLKQSQHWGYHAQGPSASEPAALAGLAACAMRNEDLAIVTARWLADVQSKVGAVGVTANIDAPAWTTSLAIITWLAAEQNFGWREFNEPIQRALQWSFESKGKTQPRTPEIGHDPTLLGWSWAADTHSWMEPTCMFVLALKAAGHQNHPRTQAGLAVIQDRLLEDGGSNFGSTVVLGQATLPQVQSTGLAMLALAGQESSDDRVQKSMEYLQRNMNLETSTASLCYGLLGLTAHGRRPTEAEHLLQQVLERELRQGPSCYKTALIALASLPDRSWLPQQADSLGMREAVKQ